VCAGLKRFFQKYKKECNLWPLDDDDFDTLVRLCLSSDYVLIEGTGYKQKSGLAMGNNLAPMLTMNDLDSQILEKTDRYVIFKRYTVQGV
jgi:hypothetical protein